MCCTAIGRAAAALIVPLLAAEVRSGDSDGGDFETENGGELRKIF